MERITIAHRKGNPMLTPSQFTRAAELARVRPTAKVYAAAVRVLMHGETMYRAAQVAGLHQTTVLRACRRIERASTSCPHCGQPIN